MKPEPAKDEVFVLEGRDYDSSNTFLGVYRTEEQALDEALSFNYDYITLTACALDTDDDRQIGILDRRAKQWSVAGTW